VSRKLSRSRVEDFLFHEARLLDENRLQDWLALFSDDGLYWIPNNRDQADPNREISLAYDNLARLTERIWKIESGEGFPQLPRSRIRRMISNVQIDALDASGAIISSYFALHELRKGKERCYTGRYEHRLVAPSDGPWRIALKKVELLANNEFLNNATFLF
jgi:benzoate/toluate 1,2-dioxygenase subunit beta